MYIASSLLVNPFGLLFLEFPFDLVSLHVDTHKKASSRSLSFLSIKAGNFGDLASLLQRGGSAAALVLA